jgi:hypothetical protein
MIQKSKPCFNYLNGRCAYGADCKNLHEREEHKSKICKNFLDGKCQEKDCKLSHDGVSPKVVIFFKGGSEIHNNGIRFIEEMDKRNYSPGDKLAALQQHFPALLEMFFTIITTGKGDILWLNLVLFTLKGQESQNLYEILDLILRNVSFRESLGEKISEFLVENKVPEFGKDPRLRGLKDLFDRIAAKQPKNVVAALSPQLQQFVCERKATSSPQKTLFEVKHVPTVHPQARVAPGPVKVSPKTRASPEPAKVSPKTRTAHEPARAPPGAILASNLMVILNMEIDLETKDRMIRALVEAALQQ